MQQTGDRTDLRDFRNMEMAIETPYANEAPSLIYAMCCGGGIFQGPAHFPGTNARMWFHTAAQSNGH